jgi:membrane protease YdiL (CAAX protease family)
VIVIGLTWAVQFTFLALGWPLFPALVAEIGILLATATVVTRRVEGREGVRRLYSGVVRWRFGAWWYALILLLLPAVTLAVAVAAGTLTGPSDGWGAELLQYLFLTLVFGALLGNLWEELAWTGFMQERLAARHGRLRGALLTALPFGLIHLPLAFEADGLTGTSGTDLALAWGLLLGVAPFFRYLIGIVHDRTGRSVLAVAILHGSFNACASTSLATGGWEYIAALVAATVLVALAGVVGKRISRARVR